MLASSVSPAPSFPHVGAEALWQGHPVVIHSRGPDSALVFGPAIQRRVRLDELSPRDAADLFGRWRAARLDPSPSPFAIIAAVTLYVDYCTWAERDGHGPDATGSPMAFAAWMHDAGYPIQDLRTRHAFVRGRTVPVTGFRAALLDGDAA